MANYVTDMGICLRVVDYSETSQIVGMLTRGHGVVPLIAKGSKRTSKKNVMSGPLDLLTGGEVVYVAAREGAGGGGDGAGVALATLAAWELLDHRVGLRANLRALNAAMMCAEVTTLLLQPFDPHEGLFEELEAALELLGAESGQGMGFGRILVAYVKAALVAAGYMPALAACLGCGRVVGDEVVRFSTAAGGVFCAACYGKVAGRLMDVTGRVVVALDRLPPPTVLRAKPPERAADEGALLTALKMLLAQVQAVTDRGVRTEKLVEGIFR
jgi:DNA repair protein RecO (recombination protein O)